MNEALRRIVNEVGDCDSPKSCYPISLLESYQKSLAQTREKAQALEEAIQFLEANPKFEEFFKIASKLR